MVRSDINDLRASCELREGVLPPEIAGKMAIPTLLLPPETADLPDRRLVKD
jgi:hypothetical protein